MKIGIDIQTTAGQKVGFGFYVENLVQALQKIDHKNEYVLMAPAPTALERDFSTPQRLIWDQIQLPWRARQAKVDILHQPCFSAPLFYSGKVVVTVHDIISRKFPQNIPFFSRQFFGRWMPFSNRRADKIIAISQHTKKDIIEVLHIPEEKIEVIYLAASDKFQPIKDQFALEEVKKKYGLSGPFILHVGTLEPRKNLAFLITAFARALRLGPIKEQLVITGRQGWYYEGLFKLVKDLKLSRKVVFTGYVEEDDLPRLYNAASLFVFPSLYEGFGLPPLEALACGTPVISSNTSSMPEVIGRAGILLPPEDLEAWRRQIYRVLTNKSLRQTMAEQGFSQAKKFSWETTALQTIKIYEQVKRTPK